MLYPEVLHKLSVLVHILSQSTTYKNTAMFYELCCSSPGLMISNPEAISADTQADWHIQPLICNHYNLACIEATSCLITESRPASLSTIWNKWRINGECGIDSNTIQTKKFIWVAHNWHIGWIKGWIYCILVRAAWFKIMTS